VKVFIFDLLAYGKHFDQYKQTKYLPYPLANDHYDPEVAAQTYEQHLQAWEEMDKLGFDGVGLNEHHTTPHGMMNSPNMMAAVAAQRTKRLKFLMLGNLVPLHNPLRIAEELAMADTMSRGRILSGFARGVPREYNVYGVPMAESRARFEEAVEIILKAWTEPKFSYEGKYWSYKDIAIWPRPYQQPHPPVWVPFTGSKETIEWAGKRNFSAVIPDHHRGLTQDVVGYYAKQLALHGNKITPDHICYFTDAYVAADRTTAIKEYSPFYLYFVHTLWHHGSLEKASQAKGTGYVSSASYDYIKPENRSGAGVDREAMQKTTMDDIERKIDKGELAWGSAKDVGDRLIEGAERMGANYLLLNMNVGAMASDAFIEQIRRFGKDVLPRLQAHQVKRVPAAELVTA
jgi:alkanesulfonate monooxygenase SsuD/methylene tetrahydromethanopterin reductase-like flavin-dependent oxidoreductase (luciferase family)